MINSQIDGLFGTNREYDGMHEVVYRKLAVIRIWFS